MGKPPVAIIIARHGARLDAANKDWHLTSSTPYDPPLSYGGWLQSRALGARIINQVRSLEDQLDHLPQGIDDRNLPSHTLRYRKQKRKIIIHSSPFLRCIQTAIAVSSGISQNYNDAEAPQPTYASSTKYLNGGTPGSATSAVPESPFSTTAFQEEHPHRCLLRVDAFLGEWLSPDYFENITPPPRSEKMVAAAKTELLRRDQGTVPSADLKHVSSVGHFPGGWNNSSMPKCDADDGKSEADATPSITRQRNRADSYDSLSTTDTARGRKVLSRINTNLPAIPDSGYLPPIPNYAISPSNPIPDGYVNHARDACVQVDYQWDSMREPQNWGSGGEYGEEWSSMHSRFRAGLDHMVSWYQSHKEQEGPGRRRRHSQLQFLDPEDEEDTTNTILVIITHGAGCNALIGALSGEPALVSVDTASLTLAVRKDCLKETEPEKLHHSIGQHHGFENYRLVEVASTDHLRPGTGSTTSMRSPTSSVTSPTPSSYRHRFSSSRVSFSTSPFQIGSHFKTGSGMTSWSIPQSATLTRPSTGLWNSVSAAESSDDDLVPNFGSPLSTTSSLPATNGDGTSYSSRAGDTTWPRQLPQRTLSQRGLWGSAPLNKERTGNVNRRWTVTERP